MSDDERAPGDPDLLAALIPEDFDWQELVRAYPVPAVLLAALGGFMLGKQKGDWILGALGSFAAAQITRHLNQTLGDEIL